jgi:hypothetical protein
MRLVCKLSSAYITVEKVVWKIATIDGGGCFSLLITSSVFQSINSKNKNKHCILYLSTGLLFLGLWRPLLSSYLSLLSYLS